MRNVTRTNHLSANDPDFLSHGLKFMSETGLIIEATRLVPTFFAPLVPLLHVRFILEQYLTKLTGM